ncbi:ArnT family glycosyltransferase [Hydrogenivirga sp.]
MRTKLLLIITSSLFFLFGNWVLSVTSPDEGKNLDAALRMLETADFVAPYYNCQPRFEKPPMFYWLTDVSYALFGVNEFSSRLVSGLSALGTDILTFLFALELFDPEVALISALIYDTIPHNWVESRAATPEMLLTFFMTLGLFLFVKGRFVSGWLALAFAFLTKGPVGVILPCAVYILWKRDLRFLNLRGLFIFLLIGSSWYLAMIWKFGFAYFYKFFIYENVLRYTGHKSIHPYPFWYYLPIVGASSIFYIPKFPSVARRWDRRLNPMFLWFLFVLLFYSLARNKLHHYVLFLYPPLAVILARYVGGRYIKAVLSLSLLVVVTLLYYAHFLESKRFVPKAVAVIKREETSKLYFYRVENSALVFYTRRCFKRLKSPNGAEEGALVVTKAGNLSEFKGAELLAKGDEFGKELVLIRVR